MWIKVLATLFTTIWLLIMSVMDIRSRRVPMWLLGVGGIVIALLSVCQCVDGSQEYIQVLGGMLPGAVLLAVAFVTKKAGFGDGLALLILGMLAGTGRSLLLLGLSMFLISVCSLILLVLRKAGRNSRIPYLPFLATAWIFVNVGWVSG